MNKGSESFKRINELDPEFFVTLGRAIEDVNTDLWLQRLDIATNVTCDVLSLIRNALLAGRYKSSKSQPYIFGKINNSNIQGSVNQVIGKLLKITELRLNQTEDGIVQPITTNTFEKTYQTVQEDLHLETVYFGETRHAGLTVAFYDKYVEQTVRKSMNLQHKECVCRIEIRYVFSASKEQIDKFSAWREYCLSVLGSHNQNTRDQLSHYLFLQGFTSFEFTQNTRVNYHTLYQDYYNQVAAFSREIKETYIKTYAWMYFEKRLTEKEVYMLLRSLIPKGEFENTAWRYKKMVGKWMSLFDLECRQILTKTSKHKDKKALPLVSVIPVIKENATGFYNMVNQAMMQGEIIDIQPVVKSESSSSLPALLESSVSSVKSRRGRKPGQKNSKPRVRRTKEEISKEKKAKGESVG